jgi:hypothetical protein
VGHWTAEDYSLKTVLLALREIYGPHTGENIGATVFKVIQEFHILNKLSCITLDNASNNDATLITISNLLRQVYGIEYDVYTHCLRCLGYIVNLVVKELLFGYSVP